MDSPPKDLDPRVLEALDRHKPSQDNYGIDAEKYGNFKERELEDVLTKRVELADRLIGILVFWLFIVIMLVYCKGVNRIDISDNVLISMIAGVSASLISLIATIVRFYFSKFPRD